jgi:hypothetical protein
MRRSNRRMHAPWTTQSALACLDLSLPLLVRSLNPQRQQQWRQTTQAASSRRWTPWRREERSSLVARAEQHKLHSNEHCIARVGSFAMTHTAHCSSIAASASATARGGQVTVVPEGPFPASPLPPALPFVCSSVRACVAMSGARWLPVVLHVLFSCVAGLTCSVVTPAAAGKPSSITTNSLEDSPPLRSQTVKYIRMRSSTCCSCFSGSRNLCVFFSPPRPVRC